MRNLTLLLLVFILALLCIKRAKASPDSIQACISVMESVPFNQIVNHPEYGEPRPFVTGPLHRTRIDDMCRCLELAASNGYQMDDMVLECQAISRLFNLIDV